VIRLKYVNSPILLAFVVLLILGSRPLLERSLAGQPGADQAANPIPGSQWPQYGFSQAATGRSPYIGPAEARLEWKYPLSGSSHGGNVLVDDTGTVYFGRTGYLTALNKDSSLKWEIRCPDCSVLTAMDAERIYVGGPALKAFDRANGELAWEYPTNGRIETQILIAEDGTIYFGSGEDNQGTDHKGIFHALRPDGTVKWQSVVSRSRPISAAAAGGEGAIYVSGDHFLALDAETGDRLWELNVSGLSGFYGPAVDDNGVVYFASNQAGPRKDQSSLFAVEPDGRIKWRLHTGFLEMTPAIGDDGTVYFHSYNYPEGVTGEFPNGVYAVRPDGTKKWEFQIECPAWNVANQNTGSDSSPTVDPDGNVYFGTECGLIYALDAAGSIQWTAGLGSEFDNRPAIDRDGTLYICHAGGGPGDYWQPATGYYCYALGEDGEPLRRPEAITHYELCSQDCANNGDRQDCPRFCTEKIADTCSMECIDVEQDQTGVTKTECERDCQARLGLLEPGVDDPDPGGSATNIRKSSGEYNLPCTTSLGETGSSCDSEANCSSNEFAEGCCIQGACSVGSASVKNQPLDSATVNERCVTSQGEKGYSCDSAGNCSSGEFTESCCIQGKCAAATPSPQPDS